ncbi:MAG TPA: hypothetical protein PKK23_07760 [Nitrospirales bacterium]|nr:hypothetical protein [Nitrospirales bacterium]
MLIGLPSFAVITTLPIVLPNLKVSCASTICSRVAGRNSLGDCRRYASDLFSPLRSLSASHCKPFARCNSIQFLLAHFQNGYCRGVVDESLRQRARRLVPHEAHTRCDVAELALCERFRMDHTGQ